ncbi:ABC transporter permease [Paenibacillus sp.]|uniref:ABC transporter permease n=1 Tax=Paenibacillus sp. TaxID=58172 RepID=UPI002D27D0C9|nr:ABC transporter permease [Paenibacillus sp.]HZG84961.1 ABC transporter permease [Paenibacillus sp.]
MNALRAVWPPAAAVAAFLLAWEGAARAEWFPPFLFPGPGAVARAFAEDAALVASHAASSFGIAVAGLACGFAFGLGVACALHLARPLRSAFAPLLILSQNVPTIVLAPLLVVWFGFGWMPKLVLLTLVCFFPIAVSTLDGLARADRNMVGYMRMAGATRWQTFAKLELPGALPPLFSGLKVSAAYSVLGAVIAEWAGASRGLGVYLNLMKSGYRVDRMFVAIAVIAALSLLLYSLVAGCERRWIRWHRDRE